MAKAQNPSAAHSAGGVAAALRRHAQSPPTETQARVLAAALELFAEHGYDGCTTAAVAARAGVTEKTLFAHFPSKRDLLVRTTVPAFQQLLEPLVFREMRDVLTVEQPSLRAALTAVMRNRVAFARENPAIIRLLAQALLLQPEFREAFVDYWVDQILPVALGMLQRARDAGELTERAADISNQSILRAIVSITLGYVLHRVVIQPDDQSDDEREIATMVDILLAGIGARS